MKFENDLNLEFQQATCLANNKFKEPEWQKCVESKESFLLARFLLQKKLNLLANICPSLPEPAVEEWDSYAVLENRGKAHRDCIKRTSITTLCSVAKLDYETRITSGSARSYYNLTLQSKTNLTINYITLSAAPTQTITIAVTTQNSFS